MNELLNRLNPFHKPAEAPQVENPEVHEGVEVTHSGGAYDYDAVLRSATAPEVLAMVDRAIASGWTVRHNPDRTGGWFVLVGNVWLDVLDARRSGYIS
jgi:hypothetical protein